MTGKMFNNIIEVRQGDSFVIKLRFHKSNQQIDLSKAEVKMQVRSADDAEMFTLKASPIEAEKGTFALLIMPEQSKIPVGDYKTDIQLMTADGAVNTIFPNDVNRVGVFRITQQVTR